MTYLKKKIIVIMYEKEEDIVVPYMCRNSPAGRQ